MGLSYTRLQCTHTHTHTNTHTRTKPTHKHTQRITHILISDSQGHTTCADIPTHTHIWDGVVNILLDLFTSTSSNETHAKHNQGQTMPRIRLVYKLRPRLTRVVHAIRYAFAFGTSSTDFIGGTYFALNDLSACDYSNFFFQWSFATT